MNREEILQAVAEKRSLRYANLQYADLREANLREANLQYADLREANLREADLQYADLQYADLRGANLRGANLRGADLRNANLQYANLQYADLRGANLREADLQYADLRGADLRGAELRYAKSVPSYVKSMLSILPEGDIFGYKKLQDGHICKLLIPKEARRSNATGRKCRAEWAIVVALPKGVEHGYSAYNGCIYKVGEKVVPDSWDDYWTIECGHGIHFFITEEEARAY